MDPLEQSQSFVENGSSWFGTIFSEDSSGRAPDPAGVLSIQTSD